MLENWQMEMLKKRAYLARFLVDVEIPAELLLEEDMNMLHAQYDLLRDRFKTTHKKLVSWRQSEQEPALVKTRVEELVMEREHLNSTIAKLRTKLVVHTF
jgi:intraflagellar transport protein 81